MNDGVKPLTPTCHKQATVNDLISRLLEKGLVLRADLIIGVAGIPLLGLNMHLALSGMSTMLRYGMMRDWDEATRAWERGQRRKKKGQDNLPLHQEEKNTDLNRDLMHVTKSMKLEPNWFKVWFKTEAGRGGQWRSGEFYVEEGRLHWHVGRKERPLFSLWPPDLLSCKLERVNLGLGFNDKPVLELRYLGRNNAEIACFSGSEDVLSFWINILQGLEEDNLEVCPECGAPGSSRRLLEEGCDRCGWLSARKQRELKSAE